MSDQLPERVGVYGGGRMGVGIAHVFLTHGSSVVIVETSEAAAVASRQRLGTSLARADERSSLAEPVDDLLAKVRFTVDPKDLAGVGLVVEAVPEDVGLKRRVLEEIEMNAPDAIIASNTSSLSITGLAETLAHPERVIGLHFFNPVPTSDLVEIVVGQRTAPELVSMANSYVSALGMTAITVTDSPGFASSRLGVLLAIEAIRMLEEGVASAADIDTAMTLGYRHPTGPLRTTDIVGLDVRLAIADHLSALLGTRFQPPQMLRDMVAAGDLGRKTGRGFYDW